ncbi:MAG: SBBP repeat-containing protein [Candidatus Magasanikbacteria bacterium]|nr:SBBP repeat-containing protein [Candidatus Magasanikbacteria bacterium]
MQRKKVLFITIVILILFFLISEITIKKFFSSSRNNVEDPIDQKQEEIIKKQLEQTIQNPFFIKNEGQAPQDIQYYFQGKNSSVYFTNHGLVFQNFYKTNTESDDGSEISSSTVREVTYLMRFIDSSEDNMISAEDEQPSTVNYIVGTKNIPNIKTYGRIIYRNIYPSIDVEFLFDKALLKYTFIVHPGGDPENIAFLFEGVQGIEISPQEALRVSTPAEIIEHQAPYTYQYNKTGEKRNIKSHYVIQKDEKIVRFMIDENYDKSNQLIIDPIFSRLSASTFIGGSGNDSILAMTRDTDGNIILAGKTSSSNFPTSVEAYDTSYNTCEAGCGTDDAFITKISSSLMESPSVSTYLGGRLGNDSINSILVNDEGNIVVAGYTQSSDFPITGGAYDTSLGGTQDGFITIFSSNLATPLIASTVLGGSDEDTISDIAFDSSGSIYIAGYSTSNDFPTTTSRYGVGGNSDGFLVKLSSNLSNLSAGVMIGGSATDSVLGLALDSSFTAYLVGSTDSSNFPTSSDAVFSTMPALQTSGFVSKISSNLTSLSASTYIGGGQISMSNDVVISTDGNFIFVVGKTQSDELMFPFPVTVGAYDTTIAGNDAYIAKFNSGLTSLSAATFLGGDSTDEGNKILFDSTENIIIVGSTQSNDFPTSTGAYQTSLNGEEDAFISKFSSNLSTLVASTFLGGSGNNDTGICVATTTLDRLYVAGVASSADFPTTIGAYDTSTNGGTDIFVSLIDSNTSPTLTTSTPSQTTSSTVTVSTTIADTDNEITSLTVEHSTNGTTWTSSTLGTVTPSEGAVSTLVGRSHGIWSRKY